MTKKIEIHPVLAANMAHHKLLTFTNNNSSFGAGSCKLYLMEGVMPDPIDNNINYGTTGTSLVTWKNNRIKANPYTIHNWEDLPERWPESSLPVWLSTYAAAATSTGTATWFYGINTQLSMWLAGTVGLTGSGADLELDDVNIVQGKTYGISNLRFQTPTSFTY